MFFRQLYDADSSTYTYLLADTQTREAVVIDPVLEQVERDVQLIQDLGFRLVDALDTHVHADHVTALGLLRERLGASTVISERAGAICEDRLVKHGDLIRFGGHELEVRETPGHTSGCVSYVWHAAQRVFTGDALLIRGCGRTDFQQGDAATLFRSVREQLFSLPSEYTVYPAHDYKGRTASSIEEERRLNPRLGDQRSLEEFLRVMQELKLPYPKRMGIAVPANLECGAPRTEPIPKPTFDTAWAPVELTTTGVPELTASAVSALGRDAVLLDVREPDEFHGELGHLPGAELLPLAVLRSGALSFGRQQPLITVCRSGGRSAKAAVELAQLGFSRVASLRGGMLAWRAQSLPIEYGSSMSSVATQQG
ncbi:MAG TPA: MBL fold metallo-hydrolase [Polyangiaceae bacterium]